MGAGRRGRKPPERSANSWVFFEHIKHIVTPDLFRSPWSRRLNVWGAGGTMDAGTSPA